MESTEDRERHIEALAGASGSALVESSKKAASAFARLFAIVARLRAEDGCPWDREQTPSSIRGNIIEEAYELVEAITERDAAHIREEAGDLYLLATMVAYMYQQEGAFTVPDSLDAVSEKLIRRHPHVFGESEVDTADGVVAQWNDIKETKEGRRRKDSLLDQVSRHLPPLERSFKLQKKAAGVGFDWKHRESVWDKVEEELAESRAAMDASDPHALEEEIGDLLFSIVNLSRFCGVDPAVALHRTNEKFSKRFRHVESAMKSRDLPMSPEHFQQMDEFWDEAKTLP